MSRWLHRGAVVPEAVVHQTDLRLKPAPVSLRYLVKATINSKTTELLIDSGSAIATLSWATAKRMGLVRG